MIRLSAIEQAAVRGVGMAIALGPTGDNAMKIFPSVLLMTVLAVPCAWAQTPAAPEQALVTIENEWSQASMKRDAAALDRFYGDEVHLHE